MTVEVISMAGRGGRVPDGAVYVGRTVPAARTRGEALTGSKYANRYTVKRYGVPESLRRYEEWALTQIETDPAWLDDLAGAEALACWCAPGPCHADFLVRLLAERL
jgi:hypothetical protein